MVLVSFLPPREFSSSEFFTGGYKTKVYVSIAHRPATSRTADAQSRQFYDAAIPKGSFRFLSAGPTQIFAKAAGILFHSYRVPCLNSL